MLCKEISLLVSPFIQSHDLLRQSHEFVAHKEFIR